MMATTASGRVESTAEPVESGGTSNGSTVATTPCYHPEQLPMNLRRIAWFGVWSLAVASWFSAASTPDVHAPSPVSERVEPTPDLDRTAAVMQAEVARLHSRLAPSSSPVHSRDLFHFADRAPRPTARTVAPVVADMPVAVPAPARPMLQLIGVAEDETAAGTVRTAIVSGLGELFLVKVGDVVSGRYRVEQVAADAVELVDTTTDASTTLALH